MRHSAILSSVLFVAIAALVPATAGAAALPVAPSALVGAADDADMLFTVAARGGKAGGGGAKAKGGGAAKAKGGGKAAGGAKAGGAKGANVNRGKSTNVNKNVNRSK